MFIVIGLVALIVPVIGWLIGILFVVGGLGEIVTAPFSKGKFCRNCNFKIA